MRAGEIDVRERYLKSHAEWRRRFLYEGAARASHYAWRLPEVARKLGAKELASAQYALALTLYTLGRYSEARQNLPAPQRQGSEEAARCTGLARRCEKILGGAVVAQADTRDLIALGEIAYFDWLNDDAVALQARLPVYQLAAQTDPDQAALCDLLGCWCRARLHGEFDVGPAHAALVCLRNAAPATAAHAEAVLAEAMYYQSPRWSLAWLDAAMDSCERYAHHHCQARLLAAKSEALKAAGELREAQRFRALAQTLTDRQGDVLMQARLLDRSDLR